MFIRMVFRVEVRIQSTVDNNKNHNEYFLRLQTRSKQINFIFCLNRNGENQQKWNK